MQEIYRSGRALYLLVLTCLVAASGCTALPDASPWVGETAQLKDATSAAGHATANELESAAVALDSTSYQTRAVQLRQNKEGLLAAWEEREQVMAALLAYAQSVQAVIDSGNSGAQSAGQVIDSFKDLASTVGYTIPGSPVAISVASDGIKIIAENLIRARAAAQLEDTLRLMQPSVQQLAKLLLADMTDLHPTFDAAIEIELIAWKSHLDFDGLSDHRTELQIAIRSTPISQAMGNLVAQPADAGIADDAPLNDAPTREPSGLEILAAAGELSRLLAQADTDWERFQAGIDEIEKRRKLGLALINQLDAAIKTWADAHSQLATAVEQRQPVNVQSLAATAARIQSLIERIEDL